LRLLQTQQAPNFVEKEKPSALSKTLLYCHFHLIKKVFSIFLLIYSMGSVTYF